MARNDDTRRQDRSSGAVTRAFDEWRLTNRDIRSFYDVSREAVAELYERRWNDSREGPADPDGPDPVDTFTDRVHGLWPYAYDWMLEAAVIKDAVTAYEVYLEKGCCEVLERHGLGFKVKPGRTPSWPQLVNAYEELEIEIDAVPVQAVRKLRHLLTHTRGELRPEDRVEHGTQHHGVAELGAARVVQCLDDLQAAAETVDPRLWELSWGGGRSVNLLRIREAMTD